MVEPSREVIVEYTFKLTRSSYGNSEHTHIYEEQNLGVICRYIYVAGMDTFQVYVIHIL